MAVPGEFGLVSDRVKRVRDVFVGKLYAEMCIFTSWLRNFRAFVRIFGDCVGFRWAPAPTPPFGGPRRLQAAPLLHSVCSVCRLLHPSLSCAVC